MKKIALTAFLLLVVSYVSFCQQDNEYVEVSIQDTICIVPDEIIFIIMIKSDEAAAYYTATGIHKKTSAPDKREEKIRTVIAEQKIDTVPEDEYLALKENRLEGIKEKIMLHFTSTQQFKRFIREIRNINDVIGMIASKKSTQESRYRKILSQRLMDKAMEEASFLAIQGKKVLGKMVQLKDEDIRYESGVAGWTSYPPLSALGSYYNSSYETTITLVRAIRVRYTWQ